MGFLAFFTIFCIFFNKSDTLYVNMANNNLETLKVAKKRLLDCQIFHTSENLKLQNYVLFHLMLQQCIARATLKLSYTRLSLTACIKLISQVLDCEQPLRMVARARKARVRKSSEASVSAISLSPVLPSLDLTEEGLLAVYPSTTLAAN